MALIEFGENPALLSRIAFSISPMVTHLGAVMRKPSSLIRNPIERRLERSNA